MLQLSIIIFGMLLGIAAGILRVISMAPMESPALPLAIIMMFCVAGTSTGYAIIFAGHRFLPVESHPAKVARVRRRQSLRPFDQRLSGYLHRDPTKLETTTPAESKMPFWSLDRELVRSPFRSSEQILAVLKRIRELVSQRRY